MSTINVVGQEIKPASDEHASLQKRFAFKVETRQAVQLGATRGREAPLQLEAADDDVVELEYSNGLREWTTVDELRARYADQAASRGVAEHHHDHGRTARKCDTRRARPGPQGAQGARHRP